MKDLRIFQIKIKNRFLILYFVIFFYIFERKKHDFQYIYLFFSEKINLKIVKIQYKLLFITIIFFYHSINFKFIYR